MNKLNSGKTIIIKINGEKRPLFEEPAIEEPPNTGNHPNTSESDSSQTDNEALVETAAAQEQTEESFDWILPEQVENESSDELSLHKTEKASKQRKGIRLPALAKVERKNPGNPGPLKSIILSVVFAVLLGTSFGVLMLKLVITDHGKPAAVDTKVVPSPKKTSPINDNSRQGAVTFAPLKSYLVQGGAFTKKEAAQQMANQSIKKGIPAETLELNGQFYLFLGAADSLESARKLGNLYQDKGMDGVFSKTLTIPEKKLSKLTASEKDFVENALTLVPLLANISANTKAGGTMSSSELKTLGEIETKLMKVDSKEIKNNKINELKLEITGALKQVKDYQQKKDHKALANVQQHLLTFLAVYYSL